MTVCVVSITDGWTGADLTGLVRSASSFLTQRYFDSLDALTPDNSNGDDDANSDLHFNTIVTTNKNIVNPSQPPSSNLPTKSTSQNSHNSLSSSNSSGRISRNKMDSDEFNVAMEWSDFFKAWKETSSEKNIPRKSKVINFIKSKFIRMKEVMGTVMKRVQ